MFIYVSNHCLFIHTIYIAFYIAYGHAHLNLKQRNSTQVLTYKSRQLLKVVQHFVNI